MSSSGRHVSYPAVGGKTDGPQALPLHVALSYGRPRNTGPIPLASWRAARDRTLAAMFAGQNRLLVTGPPGVGKTLLLYDVARVLRYVGWDAAVQLRTVSLLDDAAPTGKPRAILVDEADRLSATELQSIQDIASHTVLLAGLDSLDGRCPGWTRMTLGSLTPEECTAFIGLWLAQAGYPSTLLSDDAAILAAGLSRGVPRLLAELLNAAVWLAVSNGAVLVSKTTVEEAATFRDRLDLSSNPENLAAFDGTAAVTGLGLTPVVDVNGPRRDLAEAIARTRISPAPAAVPLSPPAWTGSAQLAGPKAQGDGEAQENATVRPTLAAARNDTRQTRPRALAFAMAGMVCVAAGIVGTQWAYFRPNAAATTSSMASPSGPEPVSPASLPAVADARLAALTPVASDRVQLGGLTPISKLRVSDAARPSTADADQRSVTSASNPDALSLGEGGQSLADLQASASTDAIAGAASPDPTIGIVRSPVIAPVLADSPAPLLAPSLSPVILALLVQRGHRLLAVGDVSGARLLYGRAAASGSGIAALSMGRTFDPAFLQQIGARIAPDAAAAAVWYQRAAALGSTDPAALLQQPGGPGLNQNQ